MIHSSALLGAVLLTALGVAGCAPSAPEGTPRDVLFVVIDTLRPDRLGVYGNTAPTSPRIDALAAESLVVEAAYAQSPWTKPSMASILTSVGTSRHQVTVEDTRNRLPEVFTTLPEVLQAAGWRTAAFSENPHVQPVTGFGQGFDEFEGLRGFRSNSGWVVDHARKWLDRVEPDERVFLYLHFIDPHGPYDPAPELRAEFVGERTTDITAVRSGRIAKLFPQAETAPEGAFAPSDLDYLRALYDAEIRGVDAALGEVLDHLDGLGRLDDAIVVVTSDHPEEFLEHGRFRHGYQVYDVNVRVPLIVRVPEHAPRRERDALVQHVDLAPTLLALLGLPAPAAFEGESFVPLLRGEPLPDRPVLSETYWRGVERLGLRVGRWRMVRDVATGEVELYDLSDDPGEEHDVAASHPDVIARFAPLLEELRRPADAAARDGAVGPGDLELERAMRGLGYTGR